MRSNQRRQFTIGVFCLLLFSLLWLQSSVLAQQANLNEAIRSVVRIRGCNAAGCNVGLGSGVIIHPSGVILTANHVTLSDKNNPLSSHLEDFIIELTENARQAPQAHYRARLLAAKPEADLALLGIYWDEEDNQAIEDSTSVKLPWLTLADVDTMGLADPLHILGYPVAGGAAINYTEAALGGFDDNGALLKVNASLNEGYSGGPVLVEQAGTYAIAGVVIRRRADVSLIRSIDQLSGLTWEPTARRVWAENVQIAVQSGGAEVSIQVSADIQALDYIGHQGRLLAYIFDTNTQQPLSVHNENLAVSAAGQPVLQKDFSTTRVIDALPNTTLTFSLNQLNTQADQVMLRLLLWDIDGTRVLWRDVQWRYPQRDAETTQLALTSTMMQNVIPINTPALVIMPPEVATFTPTNTRLAIPTSTEIPTETPRPLSTPTKTLNLTATPTAFIALLDECSRDLINTVQLEQPEEAAVLGAATTTFKWKVINLSHPIVGQSLEQTSEFVFEPVVLSSPDTCKALGLAEAGKSTSVTVKDMAQFQSKPWQLQDGKTYYWTVRLARKTATSYKTLGFLAPPRSFILNLSSGDANRPVNP